MTGVTEIVHPLVVVPQVEGEIVTPGVPAETMAEGTRAALLLVTLKCSVPVPPTVSEEAGELVPPTIVVPFRPLMAGPGTAFKVPRASTRPYPKV